MAKRGRPKARRMQEGDQQSTAAPPMPASSPPVLRSQKDQIIRYSARLAKRAPTHGPLRSPIRNVPPVRKFNLEQCGSTASSPQKNIDDLTENLNHQKGELVSDPNLDMPVLETLVAPQPPPKSTISVNYTQIGECEANDDFDPDEVVSVNPELALVNVGRYLVKEEIAPFLRAIIRKYGDIGEKSILKNPESLIFHFERIHLAYNELKSKNYRNFPSVERKKIGDILKDAAAVNIQVSWFQKRLDEIETAFRCSKVYISLKEKQLENCVVIAKLQAELKKKKEVEEILAKQLWCTKGEMEITFGRSFVTNLVPLDLD